MWTLRQTVHQEPVLGEALTSSRGDGTGLMLTRSFLMHRATQLLMTVTPVSQPHNYLPSVVTELRKMEEDIEKAEYLNLSLRKIARVDLRLCLLPAPPPHPPDRTLVICSQCAHDAVPVLSPPPEEREQVD